MFICAAEIPSKGIPLPIYGLPEIIAIIPENSWDDSDIQKKQHRANERMRLCTNLLNCEVASIMPRTPVFEK